jgi:hypothetical protein
MLPIVTEDERRLRAREAARARNQRRNGLDEMPDAIRASTRR